MRILAGTTRWFRRIIDVVLIALIIMVLAAVAVGKLVPLTGRQSIIIGGASMEPAIRLGSAVIVTPVEPAALNVGDVVSMQVDAAKTTFTHRITTIVDRPDGRWVRTQGDANASPDPTLVPATAVIGRVDAAIPYMGYLMALLSLPVGVLFVLGLAGTLLAIAWMLESLEPAPRVVVRRELEPGAAGPRPISPHALVARSLAAIREPAPLLLPAAGGAALQLVAPNARTALSEMREPETTTTEGTLPPPIGRAEATRIRETHTREFRGRFLRRRGRPDRHPPADPDDPG
jgi:signal peptidase I